MKRICNFSFLTTKLKHGTFCFISDKLTREELANIVLDYQLKFDNSLGPINAELLELKTKFTKMESDLAICRNINVKLVECLVVAERNCWAIEQYLRRECLQISGFPESVSDNALEDKIQGVLCGIDVKVDTENIVSCHHLEGKGSKGKVILKLSKRKDAEKIKLNKKKLKNIDHKKNGLSSGMKVFTNESLCCYYKLLWSKCKKLFLEKKITLFWVTNGTVKVKLLNDQIRSITHKVDLSALTHEGPLVSADRNE